MQAAGNGQPLLSALLDTILQRHRCRIKDWPLSRIIGGVLSADGSGRVPIMALTATATQVTSVS
jgi:hypothetical protein